MADPNILVLGAGAIGSYVAGRLQFAGVPVTVADQWPENVEVMRTSGLRMTARDGFEAVVKLHAIHLHELQRQGCFDTIVMAVKSYDTEWAAALANRHLADDGVVLVCQNGITDDRVAAVVGRRRTLGGVVTLAGSMQEPGRVTRADAYPVALKIGELDHEVTPRAEHLVAVMQNVGTTKLTANLRGERWAKLATNCMINALSGLSGYKGSEVRTRPETVGILVQLGAEAISVARALGVTVEAVMGQDPGSFVDAAKGKGISSLKQQLRKVSEETGEHKASMLQDVYKRRRTEIDDLNGYVSARAAELGMATPYSDAVVAAVKQYGPGCLVPSPENLAPLLALKP